MEAASCARSASTLAVLSTGFSVCKRTQRRRNLEYTAMKPHLFLAHKECVSAQELLKRSLACSEHVKFPVEQLLLSQLGEVVLSKRVPARHVRGVAECNVAALRGWRDPI